MQVYLSVDPNFMDGDAGISASIKRNLLVGAWTCYPRQSHRTQFRSGRVVVSAAINGEQDHYAVLGLSSDASSADIKRAYRLLARKYHPDVSKDSQAGEVFKSIRRAYDVLSNEATRAQYDGALKFQEGTGRPWRRNWTHDPISEGEIKMYRWAELRQQMWRKRYKQQYDANEDKTNGINEESPNDEKGSFSEVLRFSFFTLFLMQTLGCQFSLTLCSLTTLLDMKLDAGYKMGYLAAWVLGGRGGILLTICLSLASWLCGKTSSSLVALVVVAMWVGANLGSYAPLPHGALVALLHMSVKLQDDIS